MTEERKRLWDAYGGASHGALWRSLHDLDCPIPVNPVDRATRLTINYCYTERSGGLTGPYHRQLFSGAN